MPREGPVTSFGASTTSTIVTRSVRTFDAVLDAIGTYLGLEGPAAYRPVFAGSRTTARRTTLRRQNRLSRTETTGPATARQSTRREP